MCFCRYYEKDEDEDGQGTLRFGKRKEHASYGGMDEEEKAIWKVWLSPPFCFIEALPQCTIP